MDERADTLSGPEARAHELTCAIAPCEGIRLPELGYYRLQNLLGRGRIGEVWLAQCHQTGARAAFKFLEAEASAIHCAWFAREVQALTVLAHASIPKLYADGMLDDGRRWYAMEYIDGELLATYARRPEMTVSERNALFGRILKAVQNVHSKRMIHRDLTASNILIDTHGHPYLLDFGLARRWEGPDDDGMLADLRSLGDILCDLMTAT